MAPRSPAVGPLNDIPPTNGSSIGEAAARPATRSGAKQRREHGHARERPRVPAPAALPETHEVTRRYPKVPGAAMLGNALTVRYCRSYIRSMARTPTWLGPSGSLYYPPKALRSGRWWRWRLACSSRVSSENIALWKTTEKGPERLHDALADHAVAPKLRAEAAVALVDLGRSERGRHDPHRRRRPTIARRSPSRSSRPTRSR